MCVSQGSVSSRDVVVVRASYPVDGAPATVHVLSLAHALQHLPHAAELAAFPGPLSKGNQNITAKSHSSCAPDMIRYDWNSNRFD